MYLLQMHRIITQPSESVCVGGGRFLCIVNDDSARNTQQEQKISH